MKNRKNCYLNCLHIKMKTAMAQIYLGISLQKWKKKTRKLYHVHINLIKEILGMGIITNF